LLGDYNEEFGTEYKALLLELKGKREQVVFLEDQIAKMKYEPPKY
jgi:hypothetical protein